MADPWDAQQAGAELLDAVTAAIEDARLEAEAERRSPRDIELARAVLRSPALREANQKIMDGLEDEYKPRIAAMIAAEAGPLIESAVTAERERIRQLAIRNQAVCTGEEGTSCYFADLLGEPASPVAAEPSAPEIDGQLELPERM